MASTQQRQMNQAPSGYYSRVAQSARLADQASRESPLSPELEALIRTRASDLNQLSPRSRPGYAEALAQAGFYR